MCNVQIVYLNTEGVHVGVHFLLESPHMDVAVRAGDITSLDCQYRHNHISVVCLYSTAIALAQSSACL